MYCDSNEQAITPETKIGELIERYPELEAKLIQIAPVFAKLRNPILRKTIAKITTIKQAAAVGNVNLYSMLNELRITAGQNILEVPSGDPLFESEENRPATADLVYDTRPDLEKGTPPVQRVFNDLKMLGEGQVYKIITPFYPAPLITKAHDKGIPAKTFKISSDCYETYFLKEA